MSKKNFFQGESQLTEANIQRILSEYMQPTSSSSYMSRRTSHTYDITVNKENLLPDHSRQNISEFSQRMSNMQSIYTNATTEYQQAYEQGQMLMEDLNGQLLARAELISQREDMDVLLEQYMVQSNFEYEYALAWEECNKKIVNQQAKLKDLSRQLDLMVNAKSQIQSQMNKNGNSEQLNLKYVDITNQIGRVQNKIAIEQKQLNHVLNHQELLSNTLKQTIAENTKQAFREYLSNQQGTFKKLQECYGPELYQQVIIEHKQQLESLLTSQFSKKILQIKSMYQQYNKVQALIQRNVSFVDNSLTIDIEDIKSTISLKRDVMYQLQKSLSSSTIPGQQVHQLKRKVELLELEKMQLEQQVIEMTLRMESQSKRYNQISQQGFRTAEKLYGEILGNSLNEQSPIPKKQQAKQTQQPATSSSQKKRRSYSEISQTRNFHKTQKFIDKVNDSSMQSESLILSQMQSFNSLNSNDLSNLRASDWLDKACQISADDSLLQHIHDLNSTIQACSYADMKQPRQKHKTQQPPPLTKDLKKTLNMPLQLMNRQFDSLPSQEDEINVRLQTITEEQLSTNRQDEEQRLKFKIHSQELSALLIEDQNNTTKKHQFLLTASQPTTNKAQKTFNKTSLLLSDQVFKTKKSRSVDYTSKYFNTTQKTITNEPPKPPLLLPMEQDVLRTVQTISQNHYQIQPLMGGTSVFKKFSNQTQLKKEEYSPYINQNPNQLGYGQRILSLSKAMDAFEFRNPLKPNVIESSVKIDQIIRVLVPSQNNSRRCNHYYQMAIVAQKQGRIELLIYGEQDLLQWYQGIQFVKDNLKLILAIHKKLSKMHPC